MNRTPVSSSNVLSVGYDAKTMKLEVEFKDGAVYQYFDVPAAVYQGLMRADSKGAFMHANVSYSYRHPKL